MVKPGDGAGYLSVELLIGVGQGPIVLAVDAGGDCLDIFLSSVFLFYPPRLNTMTQCDNASLRHELTW